MMSTTALGTLRRFRQAVYRALGRRKDTLFELLDAALAAPVRGTLVRLSLAAPFRRGWPSACDALADGTLDPARCRALLHRYLARQAIDGRPLWAGDGTVWPRPAARTSPARTYGHFASPGIPQDSLIVGWEYQWLTAVPAPGTGWVLPLDLEHRVRGRRPGRSGCTTACTTRPSSPAPGCRSTCWYGCARGGKSSARPGRTGAA